MREILQKVSEIVAQANDKFNIDHPKVDTLIGIMDKVLRKQGMQADAVTIDCITVDKKIVFLMRDAKPEFINIALGNKEGVINTSSEYELAQLSIDSVVALMEDNLLVTT